MKIPQNASKVFTGNIFDVYQWEQEIYDGTKATFEALKRPATIQIIPTLKDKLYLSHEEQPSKPLCYTFLGGRQEKGEEIEETAKRELLEETGFRSNDWELIKTYEADGKIEWITYLFVARNVEKVANPKLDGVEKIEVVEVGWDKFLEIVTSEDFWGKDISNDIFRISKDSKKLDEFRQKILGNLTSE